MDFSVYDTHKDSPGLLFWQVSSLWKRKINEVLSPYDTTHTQFVIMMVIHYLKNPSTDITQKDISKFSRIDTMTISNSIRLLEKKTLVERRESTVDTRAKKVLLTEKGENLIKKLLPLVEEVDVSFFNHLTKDEYSNILQTLNKLLNDNK